MKSTIKLFGNLNRARSAKVLPLIIVLVAVIGFSMIGCFSLGGGLGSNSGSSSGSSSSGRSAGTGTWPSDDVWGSYLLSGLQQPDGTGGVTVATMPGGAFIIALDGGGKAALDNLVGQVERMSGWRVVERKADAVSLVNEGRAGVVIAIGNNGGVTIMPNK